MRRLLLLISIFTFTLFGCASKKANKSIALFIPGICDNSPVYQMLRDGVEASVNEYNQKNDVKVKLFVMEAGTNQAEWSSQLTALTASNEYDVIISSNPSLPDLVLPILKKFPKQKYILLDATAEGNPNIYTVCYNQYEQSYVTGYIGGLFSKSHKLALIAAQEYPVMNEVIAPYFEKGAKAANNLSSVEFRVVGNWYDATKGAELSDAVIKAGVDVILPICGGASQGVITSCKEKGAYITWFDDDGFSKAPGVIISSSTMAQEKMSREITDKYLNDQVEWGKADMVGIKEGYINFVQDNPLYISTVDQSIRDKMAALIEDIKTGNVTIK
jgi:simple sugar transport system substrate-binding protein